MNRATTVAAMALALSACAQPGVKNAAPIDVGIVSLEIHLAAMERRLAEFRFTPTRNSLVLNAIDADLARYQRERAVARDPTAAAIASARIVTLQEARDTERARIELALQNEVLIARERLAYEREGRRRPPCAGMCQPI